MASAPQKNAGKLFIVATPIGNLEDITLRAIRILKEVDLIAAEDTRHTKKLLNHFGIHTKLTSYYREREVEKGHKLINKLQTGANIALVSDAGSPGISDPGAVLVRMARAAEIIITPVPGASAITAALSVAGINSPSFLFLGFAPAKKHQRRKLLHSLKSSEYPLVFYESVHRFHSLLADCHDILGDRKIFMAREISKKYEEYIELPLNEMLQQYGSKNNKGEFVVIIYPGETIHAEGENIDELLLWYRDQTDLTLKDVSKKLSSDLGLSRSKIYQKALLIWNK